MIEELKKLRETTLAFINANFDRLIEELENPNPAPSDETSKSEWEIPLSANPYIFIGKKPAAVLFGDERVDVKSWREVYSAILGRCNENPEHHKRLMSLRNRTGGTKRVFLSDTPDGMSKALKIDEGLYGEVDFGSQSLMHVLVNHLLAPVGFDISEIKVVIRTK